MPKAPSILLAALLLGASALLWWPTGPSGNPAYFEPEIAAFEAADAKAMPLPGGIVFVGSSSIRLWETLAADMAPLRVIRRGFGGAHMEHVLHTAHRIVTPYAPRAVVVFVGGNDISSGKDASAVADDFARFLALIRTELPETDVWLMSMKPSKSRWSRWDEMKRLDIELRALAQSNPRTYFVETGGALLSQDGVPDEVYVPDELHLNAEGYRRWTAVLRPLLIERYGPESE